MKALLLEKPQTFRPLELPEPTAPGAGEALVRIHRIGICGTDYGGYLGKMPFFSYPRIPGHELGVEVLAVGAGVENDATKARRLAFVSVAAREFGRKESLARGVQHGHEALRLIAIV